MCRTFLYFLIRVFIAVWEVEKYHFLEFSSLMQFYKFFFFFLNFFISYCMKGSATYDGMGLGRSTDNPPSLGPGQGGSMFSVDVGVWVIQKKEKLVTEFSLLQNELATAK